jgi:hypothetical protein
MAPSSSGLVRQGHPLSSKLSPGFSGAFCLYAQENTAHEPEQWPEVSAQLSGDELTVFCQSQFCRQGRNRSPLLSAKRREITGAPRLTEDDLLNLMAAIHQRPVSVTFWPRLTSCIKNVAISGGPWNRNSHRTFLVGDGASAAASLTASSSPASSISPFRKATHV